MEFVKVADKRISPLITLSHCVSSFLLDDNVINQFGDMRSVVLLMATWMDPTLIDKLLCFSSDAT